MSPIESSIEEVAKSMLVEAASAADKPKADVKPKTETKATAPVVEDKVEEAQTEEDQAEEDQTEEDQTEEDQSEEDQSEEDQSEEDQSEEEDEADESEASVADSAKIKVKVDGKEVTVTLADLKKNYSGEKAIEGRLQTATSYRDAAIKDYETTKTVFTETLKVVGESIFRRTIPEPDPKLLDTDPKKFYIEKNAYDQETQGLLALHAKMQQAVALADEKAKEAMAERRKTAAATLRQAIPDLADPEKGPKLKKQIVDTAVAYGFTQEELAMVDDPRMFVLVRDLARFRTMGATSTPKVRPDKPITRTLPKVAAKRATTTFERQVAAARARAQKTGRVEDVAMTMLTQKPRE